MFAVAAACATAPAAEVTDGGARSDTTDARAEVTSNAVTSPETAPRPTATPTEVGPAEEVLTSPSTPPPSTAPPARAPEPTVALVGPGLGDEPVGPRVLGDPAPPFAATISPFDGDVLARSTWEPGCPVPPEDLRHITAHHHRPDGSVTIGELVVHADWADEIVGVLATMYSAGFPIEEMRVTTAADVADPPSDDNNTTAFVCRAVTGGTAFSQHAFGLAIDINPLWNPYRRLDLVLPPDAGPWLDRSDVRPGMIVEGDAVVAAFDAIGWGWGGRWRSLVDWQHFSANGR